MKEYIKTFRDLQKLSKYELYQAAILMGLELDNYTKKELILFLIVKNESAKAINGYEKYMRTIYRKER